MNWVSKMFSSSLGKKIIMSLTGLFLCSFLIVHMIGNLQLFYSDSGLAFNKYAVFMTTNPLIKTVSYLLYATILFHAFKGIYLAYKNQKARPVRYAVYNGTSNSHWTSRNMGILGTVILVFIVVHMSDFWYQYKFGHIPYTRYVTDLRTGDLINIEEMPSDFVMATKMEESIDGFNKITIVKNLYQEVSQEFKEWYLVLIYLFSMFAISFHLYHGFKSAFQSLGLNHKKYNGIIHFLGIWVFSIAIPASFAAMPLYFFFK
ncbi:MAG: succinate dehydrogenase cytochrome b subunit [Bacteroidia bacterium]